MPIPPAIHVGFRNYVSSAKIVAMISSDSAPMRRLVKELRGTDRLIDATQGRKTKALIFMEGPFVVLSAVSQETLARRLGGLDSGAEDE